MRRCRTTLLGCGILRKEIGFLLKKNRWPVETVFLDSALHVDFAELSRALSTALAACAGCNLLVFYGCCHPRMDQIVV
jgi:hypothetical protein